MGFGEWLLWVRVEQREWECGMGRKLGLRGGCLFLDEFWSCGLGGDGGPFDWLGVGGDKVGYEERKDYDWLLKKG